ncbi:MAG: CPBP family intramembrane metalloprotease [Gordonia sp. (in: high G+C Gram-positive bacteria)]
MIGSARLRALLRPASGQPVETIDDPVQRRAVVIELIIVGILTFGFSALAAVLSLIELQLRGGVGNATVALNPSQSSISTIDLIRQLMSGTRLFAIAGLGAYLLWRGGVTLGRVGLTWPPRGRDLPPGVLLAAVIGLPGLGLVAVARALGANAHLVPAETAGAWWRWPVWIILAIGNAAAEEIVVVAYFITRLRQLRLGVNSSLAASAVLRGGYHLYQGVGAGLGNLVMGLVFGRYYQLTDRVWPLVIAHSVMDVVAFLGYALAHNHLGWVG